MPVWTTYLLDVSELASEAYAAIALGDAQFRAPADMPSQAEMQRAVEAIRHEFESAAERMIQWGVTLDKPVFERLHLRLQTSLNTLGGLGCCGSFPPVEVACTGLEFLTTTLLQAREHQRLHGPTGSRVPCTPP